MAEKVMSRRKMEKKIREIEAEGCKYNVVKRTHNVLADSRIQKRLL